MIDYTYKINTTFNDSLTFSLCKKLDSFDGIFNSIISIDSSIKTVRSMTINMKTYTDSIVELLNILGMIPQPREQMKNKIKNDINAVFNDALSLLSESLLMIEKCLSYMTLSLKDFMTVIDDALDHAYTKLRDKVSDVFSVNNDDTSVIASLKKYSTQIINTLTSVFKTVYGIINRNYTSIIDLLNTLISNIAFCVAKTLNSAVETDEKLTDEEIEIAVNVILGTTVIQPIISSLESDVVNRLYDCTRPLRQIGDEIGVILNWNFSMV